MNIDNSWDFFYIAKALDSVNHDILQDKLCYMVPIVQCYFTSDLMWRIGDKELRHYIKNLVKLLDVGKQ